MRTVGEVAALTGVSVRTLRHYDEIGLLVPGERSESGYRLYSRADLEQLQEILGWRALGFPLAEIGTLLADPAYDRIEALRRQRELVARDLDRLSVLAAALDRAIDAHQHGARQEEVSMFEGFDPTEYDQEVRERWGDTDAYRESARRTAGYGEPEWRQIREESEAVVADFAALLGAGEPAEGEAARAVAQRHRDQISRWFYDCPPQMHRGVAAMYISDPRFGANYERVATGLAQFVHDAIVANAEGTPA
jgi:MerR family transcriptional regulator, thiopeptide resistance regulator